MQLLSSKTNLLTTQLNARKTARLLKTRSKLQQEYYISPWLIRLAYPIARYFLLPWYFGKIIVTGQENIPQNGPVIVAPTHRSRWDAIVTPFAVGRFVSGRDLHFMVSSSEMTGLQGWLIKNLGGFPVEVGRADISSFRNSVEILSQAKMLTIFPEGGIFQDTQIHRFKEGLARIALQVDSSYANIGVQILPVSIHYSDIYPHKGTDIYVDIASPLKVADYNGESSRDNAKRLTVDLQTTISTMYDRRVAQTTPTKNPNRVDLI
jgi:1-acyl-sn-glycerol-3-phosphate acyltransferase